jgi:hypothetical protein
MDLHIGELNSEVTPRDAHAPMSEQDRAMIIGEFMESLDARRVTDARREDETQLWSSVRSGTGR